MIKGGKMLVENGKKKNIPFKGHLVSLMNCMVILYCVLCFKVLKNSPCSKIMYEFVNLNYFNLSF